MADTVLLKLLRRHQDGDSAARDELLAYSMERLRHMARRTLRSFAQLRTWFETDDVLTEALLRLRTSLLSLQPETPAHFLGLAGQQIRRTLLNMVKKARALREKGFQRLRGASTGLEEPASRAPSPSEQACLEEMHELIEGLPENHRELFDLLFYQGLSQAEAAEILGYATPTIKKRWHAAKLALHERLNGGSAMQAR